MNLESQCFFYIYRMIQLYFSGLFFVLVSIIIISDNYRKLSFEMTKRFGSIVLPLQILKQQQFARKIEQIDLNISKNTHYLKAFIQKNHEICYRSNIQINKLILSTQKKINSKNKEQQYLLKFLINLMEINKCMQKQISKITVILNSKKHEQINRINQVINLKLMKVGENVSIFINMAREYNELDERYVKKSEYYIDFENNPVKYYSLKKNQEKYQKIRKMQEELELKLENISTFKGEIRDMMIELSVKISELYQNVRLKIEQLRKASQSVLEKVVQIIKGFDKISQASQRAQEQSENAQNQSARTKPRDSLSGRQGIKQFKKEKTQEYEQQVAFKITILNFITNFVEVINRTVKELTDQLNSKQFKKFYSEKAFMIQLLPPRSNQDIDAILEDQRSILNIYQGIQKIFVKEVFEEIFKRQKLYFNRFISQIDRIEDEDTQGQKGYIILQDIREKQKKYCQEQSEWKRSLDINLKDVMNRIRNQFLKKSRIELEKRGDKKSDLFSQKYFQILKLNYFQHKKVLGPFIRLDHVIAYEELVKQNRLKNVMLNFEAQLGKKPQDLDSETKSKPKQKMKTKVSCCGVFRKLKKIDDQIVSNKPKKNKEMDYFSCALKDGFMLYQGHITLYENYLQFKSSFNPNTFFGSTDIIIPKQDIYEFIRGRHIMSLLITVVTKRSSLQFTSFFSDPFDILVQVYMSNRNTEYEMATHQALNDNQTVPPPPQLEALKFKMQNQFGKIAAKQQFKVTKVNITDRINQLEVQYIYIDQTSQIPQNEFTIPRNFRVTIKQYENSMEYIFWHCQNQTLPRKKKLQTMVKNLIKQDRVQKFDNFTRQNRLRQNIMDDNISFNMGEQFSIIGGKQKHKIDVGFYEVIPAPDSTKSKKHVSVDWGQLIQNQTKNNSNFFVPQTHKMTDSKNRKQNKMLQNVSRNNQQKETMIKNARPIKEQKLLNNSMKSSKSKDFEQLVTGKSIIISENASTVKFADRRQKTQQSQATHKKLSVFSQQEQQIRNQGTKNFVYLMALALGLIFILKLFV